MKRFAVPCCGLFALLAIAAAGCLFSPDSQTREPHGDPPPPELPDQLLAILEAAYTGRDMTLYSRTLHPAYVFLLRPEDALPGVSDRLTFAEELAVAQNMFSGQPIERSGGVLVPAISSISFATFNRMGPWTDVGPEDPDFPNTERALYEIQLTFSRDNANTIIVTGLQEFYVCTRDSLIGGVLTPFRQLRGQRDLSGGSKGVDGDSWGAVKCLYAD